MQNNIPLITIITPTYNRKKLLEKAILSVINQKKDIPFEWELLIIDDGSIDGTKEYIQKYLDEYKNNIKYFYQENSGVGKARNVGLNNMSNNSDYVIFLDSDDELTNDCINTCLGRLNQLKTIGTYDKTIGLLYHCKTDTGQIIGNMNLLNFENLVYKYKDFLENKINWEKGSIIKSQVYIVNKNFRFPEDVINESILRSNIMKFADVNKLNFLYINYIGRIYGTISNQNNNKITKTISEERFRKNAIGNEIVLEIIGDDLLKFGFKKSYSDYLFRTGINWILFGEKKKGLDYLKKSLKYNFDLKIFIIFILSILSKKIVLTIYKLYI